MLVLEQLQVEQTIEPITNKPITNDQLVAYAQASGDLNPIHTDEQVAKSVGLPTNIAHGMFVMGQLGQYVNQLAGKKARVEEFRMRFGAMTFPQEQVTCSAIVEKIEGKRVRLNVYASKGPQEVVGNGTAILVFEGVHTHE